jgi:hypothetical protein
MGLTIQAPLRFSPLTGFRASRTRVARGVKGDYRLCCRCFSPLTGFRASLTKRSIACASSSTRVTRVSVPLRGLGPVERLGVVAQVIENARGFSPLTGFRASRTHPDRCVMKDKSLETKIRFSPLTGFRASRTALWYRLLDKTFRINLSFSPLTGFRASRTSARTVRASKMSKERKVSVPLRGLGPVELR